MQITLKGGEHFAGSRAGNRWYSGTIPGTAPAVYAARIPRISAVRTSASTMPRAWAFSERCENVTLKRFDVAPSRTDGAFGGGRRRAFRQLRREGRLRAAGLKTRWTTG
ncbi:MAG: hypothetical protein ACLRI7_10265 [Ruthenibacterium lactatiformans]